MFSYRDLKRHTGRQSEAIARALKSLEGRGLIHRPVPGMKRSVGFAAVRASQTEDQQKHRKRIKTVPGSGVIPNRVRTATTGREGGNISLLKNALHENVITCCTDGSDLDSFLL